MKAILTQEAEAIQSRISALRVQDHSVDTAQLLRESISGCITTLESPDVSMDKNMSAEFHRGFLHLQQAENLLQLTYRMIL